jgi:O-antigen ligase
MFTHHRMLGPLVWDPLIRVFVLFIAWLGLSALWTHGGSRHWLDDGQSLRFALLLPALYPVLDRRGLLLAALTLGLLCGQGSQLVHLFSQWAGHTVFDRDPHRISGWWDPVIAGSLLCACLGLLLGRVRPDASLPRRWLPAILTTLLAIAITGTRGGWIAAVLLIIVAAALMLRSTSRRRAVLVLAAVTTLLAIAAAAVLAAPPIRARFDRAVSEVRSALTTNDYTTDTGLRIAMAHWAVIEFTSHPLRGVGAGGYRPFAAARCTVPPPTRDAAKPDAEPPRKPKRRSPAIEPARPIDPDTKLPLPHAHAHSWFLHTLATLGLPGLVLLLTALAIALRPLWSRAAALDPTARIAAFGLLGLTLAGLFDTIHVNQQTAYMLFVLLALSITMRPDEPQT